MAAPTTLEVFTHDQLRAVASALSHAGCLMLDEAYERLGDDPAPSPIAPILKKLIVTLSENGIIIPTITLKRK